MNIQLDSNFNVDFNPDYYNEIIQNVRMICGTMKGTIPLDRDFGIDSNILDLPLPQAKAKLINEIIRQVKKYEPRAHIKKISFTADSSGSLIPLLEVDFS